MSTLQRTATLLLGLALVLGFAPAPATAQPNSFAPLVKQQRDKVVHINTRTRTGGEEGETLLPFRYPESRQGMGSGVIISADGLVLTNHHVVADAENIQVLLENGEKFEGSLIGFDPHTDLALVKIPAKELPAVTFGDSGKIEVGDWVLAIGNPLGLAYSVTAGIISAKGRNIFDSENLAYGEFLQTDAAINPGNSGGPLFNLKGEVIGVNTAISSKGQGIGFAVPSNLVVEVIQQLKEHGRVLRGWLGVVIQEVSLEQSRALRLPEDSPGVLVEDALRDAPAYEGGIRKGDVLTRFGKEQLRKVTQLQKLVAFSKPGSSVKVEAFRRRDERSAWQRQHFTVRIGIPPTQAADGRDALLRELGISLGLPTPESRRHLGLQPGVGVLVQAVTPHGLAAETGLREGDIILEADRRQVTSQQVLGQILHQGRHAKVPLLVRRNEQVLYLVLSWKR